MQAVIMAAGKSTRTYPLTLTRPKPLLKVCNKTLLEHNLNNLKGIVSEVILIVGYKKDMIKKIFGNTYNGIKLRYIEQKKQLGTAHAVSIVEKYIKNKFILMAGDDIYSKNDIKKCIKRKYCILTAKAKNPQNFGVIVHKKRILEKFVEKPKKFISSTINTSFYCLDKSIFSYIKKVKKSQRGEFELPDAILGLSKDHKVYCIPSAQWIPIGYPWDLINADKTLRKNQNKSNIIGKNSRIEGKVRNSTIGKNCIIKGRVKNSIVMDNSFIGEKSLVADSVIGENSQISAKIKCKNNAYSIVKNKKVKAGKLGAIISDNVTIINSTIGAGCKIWPNKRIFNKTIHKDVV